MPHKITQFYLPPGRGDIPALPEPKLVLDFASPEGCKAELTYKRHSKAKTLFITDNCSAV